MTKKAAAGGKDVVYVDVDDEITSIIEKVNNADQKIVALVLPKRSTVLQSIVNMKLLKRSADSANKHVVLVTTEAGLMPLAGAVGLHVASTPQSKPTIPHKPADAKDEPESVDEPSFDDDSAFESGAKPAAGAGAFAAAKEPVEDTIQLDNEETPETSPVGRAAAAAGGAGAAKKAAKANKGKNKKLKVPNFNSFRTRLLIGAGVFLLLIVGFIFANVVLPKASVAIKTDNESINTTLDVTFNTSATSVDTKQHIVPSTVEQIQKTTTQSVESSGQENRGEKARGEVRLSINPSACGQAYSIPAGSGISANGMNFITQDNIRLGLQGNNCRISEDTDVIAVSGGANYNVSKGTQFTTSQSAVKGEARNDFKGGTDNIVKILTQADINSAREKLASQTDTTTQAELEDKLKDKGLYVIPESFNAGTPEITASAKAGDQVDSVTVTQKTTYSVTAAKKSDLEKLITAEIEKQIDPNKQKVLNTGIDKATFKLQNQQNNSAQVLMSMDVTSVVGPQLNDDEIKEKVAGKKAAEAESIIKEYPGVTDVEVTYSPFWVSAIPGKPDKITITYEE